MTMSSFSITPSHIIEYLFCSRYTYFEYVLHIPQNENKYFKVQKGRLVHEKKASENIEYLRKKLGVIDKKINQYLTNDYLRGEVDEVLFFGSGLAAPLDYKFAKYDKKIYDTYKTQLYCYAVLIEENFGVEVNKGFLVYTRSKNKLIEIEIKKQYKQKVKNDAEGVLKIIEGNYFPRATKFKKRCVNCTYRNICIK